MYRFPPSQRYAPLASRGSRHESEGAGVVAIRLSQDVCGSSMHSAGGHNRHCDESQDRRARLGDGNRTEEAVSVTRKSGAEIESIGGASASSVTKRDIPEVGR